MGLDTKQSCDACSKPTSNKHFTCPPRMADGRHFTSYEQNCANNIYNTIMELHGPAKPMNSFEVRQFLINNGENLINMNREKAYVQNICGPCVDQPNVNVGTMLPEQTVVKCTNTTCSVHLNDSKGVGQGRQYGESKSTTHFDRNRQEIAPSICTSSTDDMNYYPVDGKIANDYGRYTIPSGGMPLAAHSRPANTL